MPETSEVATVDHSEEHTLKSGEENRSEGSRGTPAVRRRLPDERHSLTHHFSVGGQEGYVTVGLYEDGLPGEMFIRMSKEGSTVSGLMDSFATAVSLALQYGVPLQVLCDNFGHTRFEPSGWSGNPKIGYAKSLMDYLFRWLELPDLDGDGLPSCSAAEAFDRQGPFVNPTLANHALALLARLFRYGTVSYHGGFVGLSSLAGAGVAG